MLHSKTKSVQNVRRQLYFSRADSTCSAVSVLRGFAVRGRKGMDLPGYPNMGSLRLPWRTGYCTSARSMAEWTSARSAPGRFSRDDTINSRLRTFGHVVPFTLGGCTLAVRYVPGAEEGGAQALWCPVS